MQDECTTKTCSKCKEPQPLAAFSKHGPGLRPDCKACASVRNAAYRAAHPEQIAAHRVSRREGGRAYNAAYYASHREEKAAYNTAYYAANLEKERARSIAWKKANPAAVAALYAAHHEERRAYRAAWQKANPEKVRAYSAAWAKANPENGAAYQHTRRARLRSVPSERVLISVLYERDKGICGICKKRVYKNARDLQMRPSHDHIRPVSKGGHNTYSNSQLAHRRCNSIKGAKLVPIQLSFSLSV